jgi:hypothetical protein
MTWYDGGKRPTADVLSAAKCTDWANGVLFVGDEGQLAVDYDNLPHLLPEEKFADYGIEPEPADNHYLQWTEACKGIGKPSTPFAYSGPMTETVLLGNVAVRLGRPIEWNSQSMEVTGMPEAAALIRRPYRENWG